MIGNKFYTWFKNYYQWVGGAFNETLLLPLVRATNGLRAGAIRYDEVTDTVETYDGANWNPIPSATGFVPNSRTITINGETQDLSINRIYSVGTVTSVGLTAPAAFNVSGSPVTGSGTLALTAAGLASEYVRGDGTLANFPTTTGGGSSVSYYLNGSVNQGTFAGNTYYELSKTPILGAGTNFNISSNGYIASFITDANDPDLLEIPAGNWNFEIYFSASSSGGNPTYYIELSKWDGSGFTAIASSQSSAASISRGTNKDAYFSALAVPQTSLNVTDRLAIRIFVQPAGRTITMHTENNNLCQVITTFSTGLKSINGLTDQVQYFATGTAGNDFNIVSANDIHTFNIPTASASNRGALNATDWAIFNAKQNALTLTVSGSSGASTLVGATLNVPTYTLSGLGGVASTRTITINGTAQDLSADRTYNVGTVTSVGLTSATSGVTITSSPVTVSGDISLSIATASGSQQGLLSSTDWNTFNNKQAALTLTTTNNSGASTLVGATLNVPEYTLSGLGGVPTTRTITINGTTQDLSANRTYNVGTVTSVGLTTSTTGVTIGSTPVTGSGNITIDIATASGSTIGLLSASDWTTFNNKQATITLTTSGSSGAATLVGSTLNIPQYQAAGNYITALTGEVTASGPGSASATLTNSAVIGKVLTGLNLTGGGTIAATDSILDAFGKVQNQISAMVGGVIYKGTWNASTNTPTLASGTGSKGDYYIVTVDGSTNLDGITDWKVGDWAIFNGTTWDKVDNTDAVSSVNGFTGAVSLSTSHIGEGTNLYYTDARARAAISLTTTGDSGSATYTSGVLNVPTYTLSGLGGVPTTRTLTINGTAFDLSADRSWSVGTVTSVGLSSATSGVTIGSTPITTNGTITIAIATASGSQQGLLSSTDWTTFNNKQNALTNPVTGTGTANYVTKFTGSTTVGDSGIYEVSGRVGINTTDLTNRLSSGEKLLHISDSSCASLYLTSARSFGIASVNSTLIFHDITANATRMTLDASGNLGLGVTPSAWSATWKALQIANAGSIFSSTNGDLYIGNNVFNDGSNKFVFGSGSAFASLYSQFDGIHRWSTANSGTAGNAITFTQAMTLTAAANLGILTASPNKSGSSNALTINTATAANYSALEISSGDSLNFYINANNANSYIVSLGARPMIFNTNGNDRMTITSGGNVGIGTTSPSFKLEVKGGNFNQLLLDNAGEQFTAIDFRNNNTTKTDLYFDNTASNFNIRNRTSGALIFSTNDTERMRLDASGNLGLGVTPSAWASYRTNLQIGIGGSISASNEAGVQDLVELSANYFLNSVGNPVYIGSTFAQRYRQYQGQHQWFNAPSGTAGNAISFTQAMTLDASGRLGIGTTSPSVRLHAVSSGGEIMRLETSGFATGGAYFQLKNTSGDLGYIGWGSSANDDMSLFNYKNANLIFATNNTERMRITSGGNVGIGTTSPSTALHVVGAGTFSSSVTVNGALYVGQTGVTNGIINSNDGMYFNIDADASGSTPEFMFGKGRNGAGSGGTTFMTITNGGNVGIGTTSPGVALDVVGAVRTSGEFISPTGFNAKGDGSNTAAASPYYLLSNSAGNRLWVSQLGASNEYRLHYYNGTSWANLFTIASTGAATFSSSITTGAPSGGTAAAWKLGTIASTADRQVNRYIEVEVGGNSVWIHASLPD
jgi:hypothetical protein